MSLEPFQTLNLLYQYFLVTLVRYSDLLEFTKSGHFDDPDVLLGPSGPSGLPEPPGPPDPKPAGDSVGHGSSPSLTHLRLHNFLLAQTFMLTNSLTLLALCWCHV